MNERLQMLGNEEQLRKTFREEAVKLEVLGLLEAICGIAEATRLNTVEFLFSFILPPLNQGALLIGRESVGKSMAGIINSLATGRFQ